MAKSLAYICVEHPELKAYVEDKVGSKLTARQGDHLADATFFMGLGYCPIVLCDEGSRTDKDMRRNNGLYEGHHYSVVKECDFSDRQVQSAQTAK